MQGTVTPAPTNAELNPDNKDWIVNKIWLILNARIFVNQAYFNIVLGFYNPWNCYE